MRLRTLLERKVPNPEQSNAAMRMSGAAPPHQLRPAPSRQMSKIPTDRAIMISAMLNYPGPPEFEIVRNTAWKCVVGFGSQKLLYLLGTSSTRRPHRNWRRRCG